MGRPGLQGLVERLDPDEDGAHLGDGVDAEIGPRSMRGAAAGLDVEGKPAAMRDAESLVGRLGDDRGVRAPALQEPFRADAGCLFVGDRRDDDIAAEPEPGALDGGERDRREARLHVVGASAVQASVLDAGMQSRVRLEQPHRVEMPVQEQERPPPVPRATPITFGRPAAASSMWTSSPACSSHSASTFATAASPPPVETRVGLTESIETSRAASSWSSLTGSIFSAGYNAR